MCEQDATALEELETLHGKALISMVVFLGKVCAQTVSVGQVYRLVLRAPNDNLCVVTEEDEID